MVEGWSTMVKGHNTREGGEGGGQYHGEGGEGWGGGGHGVAQSTGGGCRDGEEGMDYLNGGRV